MYSNQDLLNVVGFLQDDLPPPEVPVISNLTNFPNSTWISFWMAKENPEIEEIVELLNHPKELTRRLLLSFPEKAPRESLPSLKYGMMWKDGPRVFSYPLNEFSNYFVFGYNVDSLYIGESTEVSYKFPSGKTVDYFEVRGMYTANASILDFGFGQSRDDGGVDIYMRKETQKFLTALAQFKKYDSRVTRELFDYMPAHIIAHETIETEIRKNIKIDQYTSSEIEQLTEDKVPSFIEKEGLSPELPFLFHTLRANTAEIKNESAKWLEKQQLEKQSR